VCVFPHPHARTHARMSTFGDNVYKHKCRKVYEGRLRILCVLNRLFYLNRLFHLSTLIDFSTFRLCILCVYSYTRTQAHTHTRAHFLPLETLYINTEVGKGFKVHFVYFVCIHPATHCNTLQHTPVSHSATLQRTATHYNTLQHTATHCNTLQHTATHCNTSYSLCVFTLQHTATHCNTHL